MMGEGIVLNIKKTTDMQDLQEERSCTSAYTYEEPAFTGKRRRFPVKALTAVIAVCIMVLAAGSVGIYAAFSAYHADELKSALQQSASGINQNASLGESLPKADGGLVSCIDMDALYNNAEHSGCGALYYNPDDSTFFCLKEMIDDLAVKAGLTLAGADIAIHDYNPQTQRVLFTIRSNTGAPTYSVDLTTGSCLKMGISLANAASIVGYMGDAAPDSPWFLAVLPRPAASSAGEVCDDVWILNEETGNARNITQDSNGQYLYDAYEDATFSPMRDYVYYRTTGEDGALHQGVDGYWVLCETSTGWSIVIHGQILRFTQDERYLLVKTEDAVLGYECSTGTPYPLEELDLAKEDTVRLIRVAGTSLAGYSDYNLQIEDMLTGRTKLLSNKPIHAHTLSRSGQTLYYYQRGEAMLHCLDLTTDTSWTIPLDEKFIEITTAPAMDSYTIDYQLICEPMNGHLLLYYRLTSQKMETQEEHDSFIRSDLISQLDLQWESASSLTDMAAFADQFSAGISFYKGKGYAYMTAQAQNCNNLFVCFEDYRTGRFYRFCHGNKSLLSYYFLAGEKELSPGASSRSLEQLAGSLSLSVQEAPLDHAACLSDGEVSREKYVAYATNTNTVMEQAAYYYVQRRGQSYMEENYDLASLQTFLTFAQNLSYSFVPYESQGVYWEGQHYTLFMRDVSGNVIGEELYLTKVDDKPFLFYGFRAAPLTQTDYEHCLAWFDEANVALQNGTIY